MNYRSKDRACAPTRGAFLDTKRNRNVIWAMTLFFLLNAAEASTDLFIPKALNCELDINDTFWKVECVDNYTSILHFYYVKIQGKFNATSPIMFHNLLEYSSLSEWKLLTCAQLQNNQIPSIEAIEGANCSDTTNLLNAIDFKLEASDIIRINLIHVPHLEVLMAILNESSRLVNVSICNTYLPSITEFRVHPNNVITNLVLKQNKIEIIDEEAFSQLRNLRSLDLSKNNLKHITKSSLRYLKTIFSLDLSYNLIEVMDADAFLEMIFLKDLYLQNNKLKNISENLFPNKNSIQILDISNNDLKVLPLELFKKLGSLTNISCSNCSLRQIDEYLFSFSLKIKTINLAENEISYFTSMSFSGLHFLEVLNMSGNKITNLTDEQVYCFEDLQILDLSRNKIQIVEFGQIGKIKIHVLLLNDNLISQLSVKWKTLVCLQSLHMNYNLLTSLELPSYIQSSANSVAFHFMYNKITTVKLDLLIEEEIKLKTDIKKMGKNSFNKETKYLVSLSHNPLFCDCHLFLLYKYIKETSMEYPFITFLDKDNLKCVNPQYEINKTVISLKENDFNCLFTTECPKPCTCGIRGKDNATFVNCSGTNLQYIPQKIPKETTVLYFNKNKLSSMQTLNVKGWNNLKELHLDNNSLTDLNEWNIPDSLRYLSLRGNNIASISTQLMHFIGNQTNFQLYFGHNNKNCTCDLKELRNFITKYIQFIGDNENIVCEVIRNETTAFMQLSVAPDSVLCPVVAQNFKQKKLIIALCIFLSIFIIMLLTYYKQRQLILSFFYIHCDQIFRLCYSEEEYDQDKIFDAFVAYSSSDRDIVLDILQELENHPPYFKLCIHERNWVPGRFIYDNILSSVQSSKRIIIVLSNTFIASPWFNLELRVAVSKMSEGKISHVIVILAEEGMSLHHIDPELRHVISKRTYLVWKERWFWEKLRYAMPRKKHIKENYIVMCNTIRSTNALSLMPKQA